jgi:hypothetical protein
MGHYVWYRLSIIKIVRLGIIGWRTRHVRITMIRVSSCLPGRRPVELSFCMNEWMQEKFKEIAAAYEFLKEHMQPPPPPPPPPPQRSGEARGAPVAYTAIGWQPLATWTDVVKYILSITPLRVCANAACKGCEFLHSNFIVFLNTV